MRYFNSRPMCEALESRRLLSTATQTSGTWTDSSFAEFESVDYSTGPAGVVTHVSVAASVNTRPESIGDPVASLTVKVFDNNTQQQMFFAQGFAIQYTLNVSQDMLTSRLVA